MQTHHPIFRKFMLILFPLILIFCMSIIYNKMHRRKMLIEQKISQFEINDKDVERLIDQYLTQIVEDVKVIRDAKDMNLYLNHKTAEQRHQLIQLFIRILHNKKNYVQMRYIDVHGQEIIQVNNNTDGISVVPQNQLQNKANRYYFQNSIHLKHDEIYVSPLDLNIENHQEVPYQPILRFITPLFDADHRLQGVFVINYSAKEFIWLTHQELFSQGKIPYQFYILNKEGQFIHHPQKKLRFSFQFPETAHLSLQKTQPFLWSDMLKHHFRGNMLKDHCLYSYYDVLAKYRTKNKVYQERWILLHKVDFSQFLSWRSLLNDISLTGHCFVLVVLLLLSLLLAYILEKLMFTDTQLEITSKIADSTNDAVVITDKDTQITYINRAYEKITGYGREEVLGKKTACFKSGKQSPDFYKNMWAAIKNKGHWNGILWGKKKDGLLCPKQLKIVALENKKTKKIEGYIGIFSEVSMNKMVSYFSAGCVHEKNNQDNRWGANDLLMRDLLSHSMEKASSRLIVIYLTVENFNRLLEVLDTDNQHLSQLFTRVIRTFIHGDDLIAQTGQNVFAIILHVSAVENIHVFVKNLHKTLGRVMMIDGKNLFFKMKMGVSHWPDEDNDIKNLLLNAMIALEWSSRHKQGEISFFEQKMAIELNNEDRIESLLHMAIENHELSMVYQPQVDIKTEKIVGMESLVRWHNPILGDVSPATFIPIAEKTQLIVEIGDWIIQRVCDDIAWIKKQQLGAFNLKCAINISAKQMLETGFTQKFLHYIDAGEIQSHEVEFEITETSLLEGDNHCIDLLKMIRDRGISVAVDDFGTGYSSLSYLHTLPIDKIKIDRSFIKDYPETDDGSLAKVLVDMSKILNKKVLTEGAENQVQIDYLRMLGCDYIQGFYYSQPLTLEAFVDYVKENKTAS